MNAPTGLTSSIEAIESATGELYRWTTETREFAAFSDSKCRAADIASGNPPPALLLWHGAEDRVVGPEVAVALHRSLQPGAAMRSLAKGDNLTFAAMDGGFSSAAHFSTSFREMFGLEPSRLTRDRVGEQGRALKE